MILTWPLRLIGLVLWFMWQIAVSSFVVMRDVLTHDDDSDPIIVEYRTAPLTSWELAVLALMVNITPGTLVLATRRVPGQEADAKLERWALFVHVMYETRDEALASFRGTEKRIVHAMRATGGGQ